MTEEHVQGELQEALVYSDDLYNLDKDSGHMILKSNNFEPWLNPQTVDLCEEVLPINPQRCIFTQGSCRTRRVG